MIEKTSDEIAEIYSAASSSVAIINKDESYSAYVSRLESSITETTKTEADWKEMIKRNADHLEIIKGYKKNDGKTSIWTTESFTDIDAAITTGKAIYS
tara:strand:- start:274 stop:567 length:294 start_codon:yes stop_codon:yes gene_type:complete